MIQGKFEGFDSCDRPSNLTQIGFESSIFSPRDLEIWWMTLKNNRAPLQNYIKLCASIISKPLVNSNWSYSPETLNSDQNRQFFVSCDLEIIWITLKNKRVPLLYYVKPCTSFQSHGWIQIGLIGRKRSIRVKIGNFLSYVTLKFEGWPWITIGHLFFAVLSLVHHFIAISEFKLESQSGNAQLMQKSDDFFVPCDLEI